MPKGAAAAGGDADKKDDKKDPKKDDKKDPKKDDKKDPKKDDKKPGDKKKDIALHTLPPIGHAEADDDDISKTLSQLARDEADYRASLRKNRFKKRWPEITKVKIHTRPWHPPPPPQRPPPIVHAKLESEEELKREEPTTHPRITTHPNSSDIREDKDTRKYIQLPELKTKRWIPPIKRRRRRRPKLQRIPPESIMQPIEPNTLQKIWHNFKLVDKNKMMLQGSVACNSKKYSSTSCGAQTGCIAVMARGLLEEKTPADLTKHDVDDIIDCGDRFYKNCKVALKCYKGNPHLQLNQLNTSFFLHDSKYTFKLEEAAKGILAKHPDNIAADADLMKLMEKYIGSTYMMILSIGDTQHFLIWGHPPAPESGSSCKTVCYIFDPHMLDSMGNVEKPQGGCCGVKGGSGAFIRYAGITSFVIDFLANYGDMGAARKAHPKPAVTLTNIDIVQKEPLIRVPTYSLELNALKAHCESEWICRQTNALLDKKLYEGKYPLASLSMESMATSRAMKRRKVKDFYQKAPKEDPPVLPVMPEKAPPNPTLEQIMNLRGENFFLGCPLMEGHTYGRDDLVPLPKSETVLHSPVDVADKTFHSQYRQLDAEKWILRGTRHMASYRYQTFKWYTGIACCLSALAMLQRHRARAWNEDTVDETLDAGYNVYRESMLIKGGPVRRLVLGEHKEYFKIRDREYNYKSRHIAIWGKLLSSNPKVYDLCKALDEFFKQSDTGILQIPGELEVAIWNEGGKFYLYHPWPADAYGHRVSLYSGGKACIMHFSRIGHFCDHFLESCSDMKKKPFSISDVYVSERLRELPEPVNKMQPVAPNRWIVRGSFHEEDARFPEDHRGRQATPTAITALALAHVLDPSEWTTEDVDETLIRGDQLYQSTMETLEKMGISLDPVKGGEENIEEEEEGTSTTGTLAAADVLNRFKVSDFDCIETEVTDSTFNGHLNPEPGTGLPGLTEVLQHFFKENTHGVFTARGNSTAIWKQEGYFYFFDPHGCDENGLPSAEPRASACLMRVKGHCKELADVLLSNLPPGSDNSFNISPVSVTATKLNPEIGAPETKLESKAFEWIKKGTHAIMMGPRGENSAIGKAFEKAGITKEDTAGRTLALPAAAAFVAASAAVPPPHMHMDHMYNFLDVGKEYYLDHIKRTGRTDISVNDLTDKFVMGVNTFYINLDEPVRLPLRLPDEEPGEGGGGGGGEAGMEEAEPETLKQIKELLFKMWYDSSKPTTVSLLVNDYYQIGIWMQAGGKVVAFDPAPTLTKGILTSHRIVKGDELRLQRIKDEMATEAGGEDEDEEAGGEGEAVPEPEPEPVPPTSCPMLIVAASPGEFIDKLVLQGGLDKKQALGPAWLYPAVVTNELTANVKDKKPAKKEEGDEEAGDEGEEPTTPELSEEAAGKYFTKISKTAASVRGRVAQGEKYFLENPNRNNQDVANAVMGIVVDHIEPYEYWKPELIDAVIKYGDRLYTMSAKNADNPPYLKPGDIATEFHVTTFNVKLEIIEDVVTGDTKAGESGNLLNLNRGIKKFFEECKHGVICAKNYCVGVWKGKDENSYLLWEPHAVGPAGRANPAGAATLVLFSNLDELAEAYKSNVDSLGVDRPGNYNFSISSVKVQWEFSKSPGQVGPQSAVPDEGYEWKVLTAFVETARGRTILRGSRPADLMKFTRDAVLQSSCGAVVAAAMSKIRRPLLWTRRTVDEVMNVAGGLFNKSVTSLGYEFRPGEDVLLPLQVIKRFVLGVNYVRYDLQEVFSGKLEQTDPTTLNLKSALERFFESHTHGILWSVPYAVAVWRAPGSPSYFMMEPHACGPTGLRIDAKDDGAACLLTFSSPKLMAYGYLQNTPMGDRLKLSFQLSAMSIVVSPIKRPGKVDPPLLTQTKAPSGGRLVPATSKVYIDGSKRRARESDRKHPPGDPTCQDAQRATEKADADKERLKGRRNAAGWLVLGDGTQFMSACHSIACKKFPHGSRGHQALAVSVMAVAMSRVEDLCRWCSGTLDQILESGDQLYQDSYLHFKPPTKILTIQQILRKFYAPGNCVCRVVVYESRHAGNVADNLEDQLIEFFGEEKMGVLVAGKGDFAVALFRNPRGFYMFDPLDRDRYGRAVAPPCIGKARACFSQYPSVKALCQKLGPNIPPVILEPTDDKDEPKKADEPKKEEETGVRFEEPASFSIYGMDVTSLRKLNKHER